MWEFKKFLVFYMLVGRCGGRNLWKFFFDYFNFLSEIGNKLLVDREDG